MSRFNHPKVIPGSSGNLNGVTAGTITPGTGAYIAMKDVELGSLSCEFALNLTTNTMTVFAEFQISDDGSTWKTFRNEVNAAPVALQTGTGSPLATDFVIPFPSNIDGARFVRACVRNQVATGATADTYALTYRYWPAYSAF